MTTRKIEIGGKTTDPIGKVLSNFYPRTFSIDGVPCESFEGIIQSLKCPDPTRQREICLLVGREAKEAGMEFNTWQEKQNLFWQCVTYSRSSREYMLLIARIYDEIYDQDQSFREALLALGSAEIEHSIGISDTSKTTLTEEGMVGNINRLRIRNLYEQSKMLCSSK